MRDEVLLFPVAAQREIDEWPTGGNEFRYAALRPDR